MVVNQTMCSPSWTGTTRGPCEPVLPKITIVSLQHLQVPSGTMFNDKQIICFLSVGNF